MPDTSPRGVTIEGADDSYDFGSGAGFYVDATEPKWAPHYKMYSYVTTELPALIAETYVGKISEKKSICGHSMGGHGALQVCDSGTAPQGCAALPPKRSPATAVGPNSCAH
eukprot:scaffold165945_cov26-Tisochrysis_lutea.AAC.1